jgi:DNA mismatch repair protein MutS
MLMIDEYIQYQKEADEKYFPNKAVALYQNGTFYEIYSVKNEKENIGYSFEIANLLNLIHTKKNKKLPNVDRSNPYLAGIPVEHIARHIPILLDDGWTIVFIEQLTTPPNPKRGITKVLSPSTFIEETKINNKKETKYLSSFYLETNINPLNKKIIYCVGTSCIDLSTGKNYIYEIKSEDKQYIFEEIYRFNESINPIEIIYYIKDSNINEEEFIENLEFNKRLYHNLSNNISNNIFKVSYQQELLKKIFPNTGLLTPIEYLDLEMKYYGLRSYIILLQFAYEHDSKIINSIDKPIHWNDEKHLILSNNALYQLNLVQNESIDNNTNINSLFDVINLTSTIIGKRNLKSRILTPLIDHNEINKRYDIIEEIMKKNLMEKLKLELNGIIDIEKLNRKLGLGVLHPQEFANIDLSIDSLIQLLSIIIQENLLNLESEKSIEEIKEELIEFKNEFQNMYELTEMSKYNLNQIDGNFFKKGVFKEIDDLQNNIDNIDKSLNALAKHLSNLIEPGSSFVKVEKNTIDGYFLTTTNKRKEILEKKLGKDHKFTFKKQTTTLVKIKSDEIEKDSQDLIEIKNNIVKLTKEKYLESLKNFHQKYSELFHTLVNIVSDIDIANSSARVAHKNKYVRPKINVEEKYSFIRAKNLRHPIIEQIQKHIEYVPNDVEIKQNGIVLFGLNGGGKSSLLKSVGLSVIMAQAGLYVSAQDYEYHPFKTIFTRIMGNDNIFKGHSSFEVEMIEMNTILKYANENSLILGDEICRGTEIYSALSIVSATIQKMSQKKTNFLFATHLHKLVEIPNLTDLSNVIYKHIDIKIENGELIFGRKLQDGVGNSLYGLEVAKFIIDDTEFIKSAMAVRNKLLGDGQEILANKPSKYNSDIFMDSCGICKGKEDLDTHHIVFQSTADKDGYIGVKHKNHESNLVVLCKTHHDMVHQGKLVIRGWVETSGGKKLDYEELLEKDTKKSKKYDEEMINKIKIYDEYRNGTKAKESYAKILVRIKKELGIGISLDVYKKIVSGKY